MGSYERKAIDSSLYSIHPHVARMFKAYTGIRDDDDLRRHILAVQDFAYRACPYPCIRLFTFTKFAASDLLCYRDILRIGKERRGAILLDIGTGLGNDLRLAIHDGYPAQNVIGVDINPQLWEIGHRLFRSNVATFPVKFIQADIFDESSLSSRSMACPLAYDLRYLRTLTPLKGNVSVLILQMLFHLFDERRQHALARRIGSLLSPARGSLIVGRQMAAVTPRDLVLGGVPHFVHNVESWEAMWSRVFPYGSVEYKTRFETVPDPGAAAEAVGTTLFLNWSIKRL